MLPKLIKNSSGAPFRKKSLTYCVMYYTLMNKGDPMMIDRLFSQGEVNKIFEHIPSRTIRFWVESGLVEWSGEFEDRRGRHRQYSLENLWQLGLVEELMSYHLPVKNVKNWMEIVSKRIPSSFINYDPEVWHTHTFIINKIRPRPKEEYESIDDSGKKTIFHHKVPGFHGPVLLPTTELDKFYSQEALREIDDRILEVMIHLQIVVDKVDYYIKRGAL